MEGVKPAPPLPAAPSVRICEGVGSGGVIGVNSFPGDRGDQLRLTAAAGWLSLIPSLIPVAVTC